jgi:hypothetical protein
MPKVLMLHIGLPKTGTSFLQSVLAGNIEVLKRHGIDYPAPRRADKAAAGEISSGNAEQLDLVFEQPSLLRDNPAERVLFSAERFSGNLNQAKFQSDLLDVVEKAGIQRVEILMFLRDPVSFAMSSYQQEIKRGRTSNITLSGHFSTMNQPGNVNNVLDFVFSHPEKIVVTVRNYSVVRMTLLDEMAAWLGVPLADLVQPPVKVVNRSMTASELMVLKAMNKCVEGSSGVIADAWCNRLPDVLADDQRPPIEDQEALWERLGPEIERVNSRIDPAHAYDRQRDINPPKALSDRAEFSKEQIEVMAEAIAGLVAQIREFAPKYQELVAKIRAQRERNLMLSEKLKAANGRLAKLRGGVATPVGRSAHRADGPLQNG